MAANGEGIYRHPPVEGLRRRAVRHHPSPAGQFGGARDVRPYTAEDIRFTSKGDSVYAFLMVWPETRSTVIRSLASNSPQIDGRKVADVSLLGYGGKIEWTQDEQGLNVKLPGQPPGESAVTLRIKGVSPS